jgi:hypothetical protein
MPQIGCNIYFWGGEEQSRLLTECLGPAVVDLRSAGLARGFWFDRFDARGPHLFVLVAAPPEASGEASRRLSGRLDEYLAARPSAAPLSPGQVSTLHTQTRGKSLCAVDTQPGLAGNNSYVLFEQPATGYPFYLLGTGDELWRLLNDLTLWAVEQLAAAQQRVPLGAAVRWVAALDRELRRLGVAGEYWRYHATTLLLGLEERLAAGESEALDSVPAAVGPKNFETFSRIWREAEHLPPPWPHLPRLAEILVAGGGQVPSRPFAPLREAVHCFLKQLGAMVSVHIPIVLFAWHLSARPREAASP